MKTINANEGGSISDLEMVLDVIKKTAQRMRPGSFPAAQLNRMGGALGVLLDYLKLDDSPMDTGDQNNGGIN